MDYAEHAARIRADYDRQVEKIRNQYERKHIPHERRDTMLARALLKAQRDLAQLREAESTARAQRRATIERRLFAPGNEDGNDPATRAESFRQARDRAAAIDDEGAMREAIRKAVRAGDRLQEKALLERAHELNTATEGKAMNGVIASYLNEVRPDLIDDYRELRQHTAEGRSLGARFARESSFLVVTPTELGKLHDYQIERVAADERFADVN